MRLPHTTIIAVLTLIASALLANADAAEFKNLQGKVQISQSSSDASLKELGLIITGEFARVLYDQLSTPEKEDVCTGGFIKRDLDGLFCLTDQVRSEYKCSLGYIIGQRKVTTGPLSC